MCLPPCQSKGASRCLCQAVRLLAELTGNIIHILAFDMFQKVSKAKETFPKAFAATNWPQLPS